MRAKWREQGTRRGLICAEAEQQEKLEGGCGYCQRSNFDLRISDVEKF